MNQFKKSSSINHQANEFRQFGFGNLGAKRSLRRNSKSRQFLSK